MRQRLRGGGGEAEGEGASQDFGEGDGLEAACATQAFCDDDDDAAGDVAVLAWRRDGQAAGVAAALPKEGEVLAIGRDEQPALRGDGVAVRSLRLVDGRPHGQKVVSSLQAEIVCRQGAMVFVSKGQSFNFLNGKPLHAKSKKLDSSAQLFDEDVLRLGGDLDGKPMGGVQDFVLRVEASSLGRRPEAAPAAEPAAAPAPAAPSGGDDAPRGADAAAAAAAAPKLTPLDPAGGAAIVLASAAAPPLNRTSVAAGFITSNRNGSFDLHATGEGVAYCRGAAASWVNLAPGSQRQIAAGALVEISGVRYRCDVPAWRVGAAPAVSAAAAVSNAAGAAGANEAAVAATGLRPAAAAEELAAMAARTAQLHAGLAAGLTGQARSQALGGLRKLQAAQVTAAIAIAEGEPLRGLKQAAGQVAKAKNEAEKRQRRDGADGDRAAAKAQRRERHADKAAAPRRGVAGGGHGGGGGSGGGGGGGGIRKDRRTYPNRTVARAANRRATDERRRVRFVGGGSSGGGGGGSGGGGGRGHGRGRGRGGWRGRGRGAGSSGADGGRGGRRS